ncbi:Desert hedgehog protein [Echinococcus granulosus]|uniref:Desert hedgehog protein n=1 Tax=Echinococcus granulosus TaxID=6210 RepID=W6U649_ECHGR|nr:Desert hedgehog protein [Echinococcus granulosus]EUB56688.1 Desert hedgehog protein [Echinococcus granulosus]
MLAGLTQACIRTSTYYRSQYRSQTHVFVPDEYRPMRPERSLEASGPLETQDFLTSIPTTRLVRMEGPNLQFASEEARWMTKVSSLHKIYAFVLAMHKGEKGEDSKSRPFCLSALWVVLGCDCRFRELGGGRPVSHTTPRSGQAGPLPASLSFSTTPALGAAAGKLHHPARNSAYLGCRDRLQKLVSLVHNTWPNNDIGLRILDGWIKPPASILRHSKVITKRDYMGRHKQTLKMSVPEELVNFEALNNAQQLVSRYPSASNGLGIKVANSDNRVVMQRPLPKQSNHTDTPPKSHIPHPYSIYRDRQWSGQDPAVVGFESPRRQLKQHPVMMEGFHYAGRAVDMILVDTKIDGSSRLSSVYPGKLAQLAYYGALFDWCYFARQGHVHCSVKPDSIITSQWFGCFPGSAHAMSATGTPIPLSALRIGDHVMTLDPRTYKLQPTRVTAFLHRDEHQYSPWIEITYFRKDETVPSKLRLTANHLIYRWQGGKTSVFANQVQPGDEIACNLDNPEDLCQVESTRVVNSSLTDTGVYAPLTRTGDMIIDGVFVSCFAHIRNDWLAQVAVLPLHFASTFFGLNLMEIQTGVHRYAELLLKIAQFLIPDQLFTSRF